MASDSDPRDSVIRSLLAYDARISSGFLAVSILIVFVLAIPFMIVVNSMGVLSVHVADYSFEEVGGPTVSLQKNLVRIGVIAAVAATGALGGAISIVTYGESIVKERQLRIIDLITIQYIGAIFACILSFVFFGGFVGGSLFPQTDLDRVLGSRVDFAKLLVWAFIAGFAQRFVPQILSTLIKRSTKSEEEAGDKREQTRRESE